MYLSLNLLKFLEHPKRLLDTDPIDTKKLNLIKDIGYFQRLLILRRIHYKEQSNPSRLYDSSSSIITPEPLHTLKAYSYTPGLYDTNDQNNLVNALNILEQMKSTPWDWNQPSPSPQLPDDYIALQADKGGTILVFPKKFYFSALNRMLDSQPDIYLNIQPSNAKSDLYTCEKVIKLIQAKSLCWGLLEEERKFIIFSRHKLPKLRGNPKFHKLKEPFYLENLTFRPIISGQNGPLCGLSIFMDTLLRPWANLIPSRLKDSFHAIEKIKQINFENFLIHCFDASSLYTSFDVTLAKKAIEFWLRKPDFCVLLPQRFRSGTLLLEGVEILFTQNYFSFDGSIFLQQNGLAMGTQCAVCLAEVILGYLEQHCSLEPPTWFRYIDDGLAVLDKRNNPEFHKIRILNTLNHMDNKIQWTSDPLEESTPFLDLEVNNKNGAIKTYHKPTASFSNFVPFSSAHPFHMKKNIAFNLYFRAARINTTTRALDLEFMRIDLSLQALGYPFQLLEKQKMKAQKHRLLKVNQVTQDHSIQKIFFVTTRNEVTTSKKFNDMTNLVFKLLSYSPYFSTLEVDIRRSFRQPPKLSMKLIWSSLACADDRPVTCGMNACKICCDLYTQPYWTSNEGFKLKVGRITCKSKNLIYILIDKVTNEVLYVGQTCQNLNTRLGQNRKRNTWHRTSDYSIVAIQSNLESVKRIEHEQFLIQILKPSHNKHVQFFWWQAKSSYSHLTDNDTSN